jgi:hypothetical protein
VLTNVSPDCAGTFDPGPSMRFLKQTSHNLRVIYAAAVFCYPFGISTILPITPPLHSGGVGTAFLHFETGEHRNQLVSQMSGKNSIHTVTGEQLGRLAGVEMYGT